MTGRTRNRGIAALAALAVVTLLPGTVGVASADEVPGYRPADGATVTKGTPVATDAPTITPGMYRDTIKRGEQKYYAVTLDAKTSAYFSAVAAPRPGTKVEPYGDKLKINLQNAAGDTCGSEVSPSFHGGGTAYPIADYVSRDIGSALANCQEAGPYYLVIGREGSATSGPDRWPIELDYLDEPPLKGSTPAKPGEGTWSTATPAPPTSATKHTAKGGTGFNDAGAVAFGVWKDRIRPGETRFYRVPVDWGQRLNLSAELPNASSRAGSSVSSRIVSNALGLGVFNPARGLVSADSFVAYMGKPISAKAFTAPVDYGNRFRSMDSVRAMRFAGWYSIEVTLNADAAQYFSKGADLTLRVDVRGNPKSGPGYAKPTSVFSVTPEDQEMAQKGQSEQQAEKSETLLTVAYAGIGTGVVLLTGLGVWTVAARRRAGAPGATGQGQLPQQSPSHASQPTLPS